MKRLIFWLVILFFATWVGLIIQGNSGYVLIVFKHISIETSLWVAIFSIFLLYFLSALIFRFFNYFFRLPKTIKLWSAQRTQRQTNETLNKGLCDFAQGDWNKAEKAFKKVAKKAKDPFIYYLSAARAAQEQENYEQRDAYLQQALNTTSSSNMAISLTQAQLQLDSKQWEQALVTLRQLQQSTPHHKFILALLKSAYIQLDDYTSLLALLPELRRHKVLSREEFQILELSVYQGLLKQANRNEQGDVFWEQIPKSFRKHPDVLRLHTKKLIEQGKQSQAEKLLREALHKQWNTHLVYLYGFTQHPDNNKQLKCAEHWLALHPSDEALLLTLGRIALREKLWGKAENYLKRSIEMRATPEAYFELGNLFEQLNRDGEALMYYRHAAKLATPFFS